MLERALELAERGRGTTHPNPVVGAVVVRDGEVVGEGWHERKGGPHAEVAALEAAGEAARGATLYVTLEPCDHHGTTPPCVDAILAAGIAKVVVGAKDPTRDGIARLREAGVEVELADLWEARVQNEAWLTWARLGRPFVTYKAAVTLDGRVTVPGERVGSPARRAGGSCTSCAPRRTRSPSAWAPSARTTRASTPATWRSCASRAGSRSAAGRCPRARSSSCSRARSARSSSDSPGRTCSRSCSRAARRSPASFLEAGLVDKLLVFVAPAICGRRARLADGLQVRAHASERRVRSATMSS